MIKSTCIKVDDTADKAISLLIDETTKKSAKTVLKLIRTLSKLDDGQFVSVDSVEDNCSFARSTISGVFTWLGKHNWTYTDQASNHTEARQNTKIILFKALEDLDNLPVTPMTSRIVAETSKKKRIEQFDKNIPHEVLNDEDLPSTRTILPYTQRFANLTSPGMSILHEIESIEYTSNGEPYTNSATSSIGIMNDYDFKTLEHLFSLTHYQVLCDVNRYTQSEISNIRFTIRMVDILRIGRYHDDSESRKAISESIDRIRHSIFTLKQNDYIGTIEAVTNNKFSFLTRLKGISARAGSIDESIHPYMCVSISWDATIINYLLVVGKHFVIGEKTSFLAPHLNRIYHRLRSVYFAKDNDFTLPDKKVLFDNPELDLLTLTENVWSVNSRKDVVDHRTLVKDIIGELKLNKTSKITTHTDISEDSSIIKIDLLGFEITFDIPRYHRISAQSNRWTKVHISADRRHVIEESGATFNVQRNNNQPVIKTTYLPCLPNHPQTVCNYQITLKNLRTKLSLLMLVVVTT